MSAWHSWQADKRSKRSTELRETGTQMRIHRKKTDASSQRARWATALHRHLAAAAGDSAQASTISGAAAGPRARAKSRAQVA
eukprot:3171867-Pyramimonas_sp.AAC.1